VPDVIVSISFVVAEEDADPDNPTGLTEEAHNNLYKWLPYSLWNGPTIIGFVPDE